MKTKVRRYLKASGRNSPWASLLIFQGLFFILVGFERWNITYLLKEGPLGLIVKANELLHDHHLTRLPVGHLITHTQTCTHWDLQQYTTLKHDLFKKPGTHSYSIIIYLKQTWRIRVISFTFGFVLITSPIPIYISLMVNHMTLMRKQLDMLYIQINF